MHFQKGRYERNSNTITSYNANKSRIRKTIGSKKETSRFIVLARISLLFMRKMMNNVVNVVMVANSLVEITSNII